MTKQETLSNSAEFTVSEVSGALKRMVEDNFGYVRVRGEISGYRGPHSSGHCYFALKDERAKIDAVIWRGAFSKLRFRPEEGMEVVASGKLTTYPGRSSYQIVIETLEPAGVGALMALLEERKKKLAAEGLFAEERKRPLPYLPRVIGVVTSPTGAVIRDILHRLADRFPRRVLVWPVRVQGETSAEEVAAAINGFNALDPDGVPPRPDVIIVARGGGSIEELWGFNEEAVVRAAAASAIPLISAVGHETDWTLLDLAADLRAPTPTAAAELAVPVRSDLLATLDNLARRRRHSMIRLMEMRRAAVTSAARGLPRLSELLALPRQRLDGADSRLDAALKANVQTHTLRLSRVAARLTPAALRDHVRREQRGVADLAARARAALPRVAEASRRQAAALARLLKPTTLQAGLAREGVRLAELQHRSRHAVERQIAERRRSLATVDKLRDSLNPKNVLARGFALVRDGAGQVVASAMTLAPGADITVEFADGRVAARTAGPAGPGAEKAQARPKGAKPGQGSLF